MSEIEYIVSGQIAAPGGHYSHAAAFDSLVFFSGQLPITADGRNLADRPFEEQAKQALSNLLAVAAASGCSQGGILKVTAFIVGIENWPLFNGIYAEEFGNLKPARAIVPVPALHYGCLVEIEAVGIRRVEFETGRGEPSRGRNNG